MGLAWGAGPAGAGAHPEASPHRLRGRGRRRVPEADEEAQEEEEKEPVPLPPQSDDTRVENMDISDEGEGPAAERGQREWDGGPGPRRGPEQAGNFCVSTRGGRSPAIRVPRGAGGG